MEQVTIQITWGGSAHSFSVPADVAGAWMAGKGIALDNVEAALREASGLIVAPIVQDGLAALGQARGREILASVKG